MKTTIGTEVGLVPCDIVLDGDPTELLPTERGTAAPTFRPMSIVAKRSPISATAELLFLHYRATHMHSAVYGIDRCPFVSK